MTPEDVRKLMSYLEGRVRLEQAEPARIAFDEPTKEEMLGAGLQAAAIEQVLRAAWWPEMIADIVETPEFCEPGDSAETILGYARDVVGEAIRKRFSLGSG